MWHKHLIRTEVWPLTSIHESMVLIEGKWRDIIDSYSIILILTFREIPQVIICAVKVCWRSKGHLGFSSTQTMETSALDTEKRLFQYWRYIPAPESPPTVCYAYIHISRSYLRTVIQGNVDEWMLEKALQRFGYVLIFLRNKTQYISICDFD